MSILAQAKLVGSVLIIAATSFCLGILFSNWSADHSVLWVSELTEQAVEAAETHYLLLAHCPRVMQVVLHSIIVWGFIGHVLKLYRATTSNYLFDGASLILYLVAFLIYGHGTITGIIGVRDRVYGDLSKEDHLRVVAAGHCILAVVLSGVLVLQVGQWWAEKAEEEEVREIEEKERLASQKLNEGKVEEVLKEGKKEAAGKSTAKASPKSARKRA
ncbi:Shr3 amino acid permease chaperone [Saitoella complicata NRRL Y-17804]|uniref:Shr3 amino acid permease chaperone n=1 Tax=Saitoella complicata (strain BCRC 22490 / CBS 7301 / JCM 7358 / NBRC 10748 / NRRL Y-17804) TaxID=698492 RepID=UPI000868141C|nr:Shr3 amino acid permease chaperone [Saitoella complicata NRRL Y-17804]ODQ50064.1 Shr3 amino acid permease chaperone [Saitoella complicata NRRL Y-17804]